MKRLFIFLGILLAALAPLACQKTYNLGPVTVLTATPVPTSTSTPSFNCAFTVTPVVACLDPYATAIPTPGPCLSSVVPNGIAYLEICNYSNNGLTKTLWFQHITLPAGWTSQISLSPSNQVTSFGVTLFVLYTTFQIGAWDATDSYGNPVPNGCYAVHLRYTDSSGNFQQVYLPVTVNRPLGRVMVDIFNSTNQEVKALYRLIANPGPSTSISSMTLSTTSLQPSYCNPVPPGITQVAISCSNGMNLVWDGRDNNGTILPAGTYTVKLCASDDVSASNLTGTVSTAPLNETSAASTVFASPNPLPAGNSTVIQAIQCGGPLTLKVSIYDSSNSLLRTVTGAVGTNQVALTTSGLTAGNYTLKVAVYDAGGYTGTETVPLVLN